jgi:hypothetical protein
MTKEKEKVKKPKEEPVPGTQNDAPVNPPPDKPRG